MEQRLCIEKYICISPKTAVKILKKFRQEMKDQSVLGLSVAFSAPGGYGPIAEIVINEKEGFLFIKDTQGKHFFSLSAFTEISW